VAAGPEGRSGFDDQSLSIVGRLGRFIRVGVDPPDLSDLKGSHGISITLKPVHFLDALDTQIGRAPVFENPGKPRQRSKLRRFRVDGGFCRTFSGLFDFDAESR
jgi:hypothetical protein